ncbi:MAG: flagellar basal body P-ring formation chaperone FlgA [Mariprofundaceae bacterium]|nr:flagellar basal body P-ring formation chaperone FlgA [Mariprofundaceae bacterium]
MFKIAIIFLALLLPAVVLATADATAGNVNKGKVENTACKTSLMAFFASQPMVHGAVATLDNITSLPHIQGKARWSLPPLRFLSKRVSLIAEQGQGKSLRRWYVPVTLNWMKEVVTLNQDISARAMLSKDMLSVEMKNVAGMRGSFWSAKGDVVGLKTLRALRRGDVLLSTKVVRPPLIQRGDPVTIVVNTGALKVRVAGVALKSANRGDRLLVQNVRSRQTLQSIVQDAHTVTVHLGGV